MNLKNSKLEYILEKYSKTRGDDKLLFIKYLQEYNCETEIEKAIIEKVLLKSPTQATLQRSRAWYQNELGMYLPGIGIINKRKESAEKVKQKIRKAKKIGFDFFGAVYRFIKK